MRIPLYISCMRWTLAERFGYRGLAQLVIGSSSMVMSACGWSGSGARSLVKFSVEKEVIYTPSDWPQAVRADIYRPLVSHPTPAVLLIHGGSWAENDNRYQMSHLAKKLARRGYLVMNATYRLAPEWNYPAPVDDLREALKWMRDHAKRLNLDPQRIGLYGYSAGGHLAEMLGFQSPPDGVAIQAVVAGATPQDLTLDPDFPVVPVFIGKTFVEDADIYRSASPMNQVTPETPPLFIYQGTKDKIVPPEHTYRLLPKLENHQVHHEIHWVKGRSHISTFLFPGRAIAKAIDFLDRQLQR
ncbi:alpha/beta hydrolase [Oceaniferula flava]|nr:alpha/beta hydrolase [Oceaniferula flavus]